MSSAFLCVQFRNLLPSEQLVLRARALWSDKQVAGVRIAPGDATLSITQRTGNGPRFEVGLSLPGVPQRGAFRHDDALVAIEQAFSLWSRDRHGSAAIADGGTDAVPSPGKSASAALGG